MQFIQFLAKFKGIKQLANEGGVLAEEINELLKVDKANYINATDGINLEAPTRLSQAELSQLLDRSGKVFQADIDNEAASSKFQVAAKRPAHDLNNALANLH